VFLRLIVNMNDRFLEQRINFKFRTKLGKNAKILSLKLKHDAFNMIRKANDKAWNGNNQHSYDPRKIACVNHK
jgi:hypothetical protein